MGWYMLGQSIERSARIAVTVSEELRRNRRAHISDFLTEEEAQDLLAIVQDLEWRLIFNQGAKSYQYPASELDPLDVGQRGAVLNAVYAKARSEFQFLYDTHKIITRQPTPLAALFAELNSEPMLTALRALTGDDRIVYLDAQATRYRPGHFLTQHNDDVANANRLFAYVLNLTPDWRVDWGGLLQFISEEGHVEEAYAPRWRALNIFQVPQVHSVSIVAPFAGAPRYSITGWMRSKLPTAEIPD